MFFPRLRRQAKWVFVFLALVFGVGFVAFGVGSGSTGISDILRGNFFGGGTSTSSQVKDKKKAIEQNPKNISAYLDLAGIYQQDQQEADRRSRRSARRRRSRRRTSTCSTASPASTAAGRDRADATPRTRSSTYYSSTVTPPGLDPTSHARPARSRTTPYSSALQTKANDAYTTMINGLLRRRRDAYQALAVAAAGTSQESNAQLQLAGSAAARRRRRRPRSPPTRGS